MNDFLSTFTDSEYQGCIGMELIKRPNSGGYHRSQMITQKKTLKKEETKDKTFCEINLIWKKL